MKGERVGTGVPSTGICKRPNREARTYLGNGSTGLGKEARLTGVRGRGQDVEGLKQH